jgi:hypothetical protein
MAVQTNVALPVLPITGPFWTLIFTAAAPGTINVHNRGSDGPILVRVNGSAGTVNDPADAPAEVVLAGATLQLALATGDLVFSRMMTVGTALVAAGRVTVRQ